MKSRFRATIQTKIMGLSLSGLILCALAFGGLCLYTTDKIAHESTEKNLHCLTDIETIKINNRLKSVEQYVNTLNIAILGQLDSIGQLTDDEALESFTHNIRALIGSTIGNTEKAVAAYLRFNPRLTHPTSGIFMAKTSRNNGLTFLEPTDFSKFSPDDVEHVGWYYIPVKTRKPTWMLPYQNKNISIHMISYVIPLFKFGKEIGVVGVDIDFEYITHEIASISIFNDGYAFLEDKQGKVLFHPSVPKGHSFAPPGNSIVIHNSLVNGMDLKFVIPRAAITANRDNLIKNLLLVTVLILVVLIFASLLFANSLTKPLKFLTDYANRLIDGKMGVGMNISRNDEIGDLANSFISAKMRLAETMGQIKGLAFRDPITNVRNKNSFDHYMDEFDMKASVENLKSYGVLIVCVDNLFKVRNKFGSTKAGVLLQTASRLVCKTYDHSPVFRVSDNEFVVILMHEDLKNNESLFEKLKSGAASTVGAENPWERVTLSIGVSFCDDAQESSLSKEYGKAESNLSNNQNDVV